MNQYQKIVLPKAIVYLTQAELHSLLLGNMEIYRNGLTRGKSFSRTEAKNRQYEKKFAESEGHLFSKRL